MMICFLVVAATPKAAGHLDVSMTHHCELNGALGVEYGAKINSTDSYTNVFLRIVRQRFSDASANYTWETVDLSPSEYRDGTYYFYYTGLSSTDMVCELHAMLYATKGSTSFVSDMDTFTIKSYCMNLLNQYTGSDSKDVQLRTMLVDLLNLGATMQTYFQINTANLPNADLTSAQKAQASSLYSSFTSCSATAALSGATAALDHYDVAVGSSLCLTSAWRLNTAPGADTYLQLSYTNCTGVAKTVQIYSNEFVYDSQSGLYMVYLNEISIPDFQAAFTIQMKTGTTPISGQYTYSGESYFKDVAAYVSSPLWNLIQNMMTFCNSARIYFGNAGSHGGQGGDPIVGPVDPVEPFNGDISTYKNSRYTTDMPTAVIIIPTYASKEEEYAASLLQKYIKQEDGYTPTIYRDTQTAQGSKGFEISVGNTNRPHGTATYTADGSYNIESYTNGVSILGVGKRGTIDGAMKFLALCGGYYWLSYEDGYRTNQTHFKYSTSMNYDHERAFLFTDVDVMFGKLNKNDNRMCSLANGLNGFYVNCVMGSQAGYQSWYLYHCADGAYGDLQPGQAHTLLAEYITPDQFNAHPDWFSMVTINGVKQRSPKQLCLTNPEVYEQIRNHVFDILENGNYDPNAPMQIICLAQADNEYYCECSDCYRFRMDHEVAGKKEGLCDAALYLDLCNKISQEVKAAGYTNVYIDMLAYTWNQKPPVNMTIDDHVIVRYAAINRCYAHDCDDQDCLRNRELVQYLNGWAALCNSGNANLWIWDYNISFRCTLAPYLNIDSLAHDIKYYYDIGVSGIYLQSNDSHDGCNTEFGDLRNYLGAVLMENPNADVEMEIQFFMNEFYGASAPYILEAMRIMETQARNHNPGPNCQYNANYWRGYYMGYLTYTTQVFANDYPAGMDAHNEMPLADLQRCEELWNLALQAAANDTARHQYTTGRTELCWRFVKSCMKVYEFADPSTYRQKNQELFNDIFDTYGTRIYSLLKRGKPGVPNLDKTADRWA